MTAQEEQQEFLAYQNAALMEEVARLFYIVESVRVTKPELVAVYERSWALKKEAEASGDGSDS
jgi:hypothetical protein